MNYLEQRILNEGTVIDESILNVNHFLNQQIDINLLRYVAEAFSAHFKEHRITKILTIEASGIAFAVATALQLGDQPVIFAKKGTSKLSGDDYQSMVFSYTKKQYYGIGIPKSLLGPQDQLLIIDDFLADGNAVLGLLDLVEQGGARVAGIGIVIEKSFQSGPQLLAEKGYEVFSLAKIKSLKDNHIELQL